MPHVFIRTQSGRSPALKAEIADQVARALMVSAGCPEEAVSVSIEDVEREDWVDSVYKPDGLGKPATLYKKPGYDPL
jgi:4-oxalocrotonate tautomerase